MTQYRDFEAQQRAALKPVKTNELRCVKCSNRWFEAVEAMTIDTNITYTLQQKPMPFVSHHVLKCLKCGDLQELPMVFNSSSRKDQDSYTEMYDELSKPLEEKKEETPVVKQEDSQGEKK
jgi:hypothetical protein